MRDWIRPAQKGLVRANPCAGLDPCVRRAHDWIREFLKINQKKQDPSRPERISSTSAVCSVAVAVAVAVAVTVALVLALAVVVAVTVNEKVAKLNEVTAKLDN